MMVGREVLLRVEKPPATPGPVRLALKGLCVDRQAGVAPLTKVDLELRALLATKDAHPRFADFRRKVLDKAVSEINSKTDLEVSWEPVKKGRSVAGIKFFIKTSSQPDLFPLGR